MRDLQECQAEVFRRSEKRIKSRRQRTVRLLAICIPLVICLVGIPLLSGGIPAVLRDPPSTNPATYLSPGGQQESLVCSIVKITVSGPDFSRSITELSHISSISDQILFCDTSCAGAGTPTGIPTQGTHSAVEDIMTQVIGATIPTNTHYTVTLIMKDGTEVAYSFAGCTLRDLTTGLEYVLPQENADQLAKLLGILP